jgi:hypothetical protein
MPTTTLISIDLSAKFRLQSDAGPRPGAYRIDECTRRCIEFSCSGLAAADPRLRPSSLIRARLAYRRNGFCLFYLAEECLRSWRPFGEHESTTAPAASLIFAGSMIDMSPLWHEGQSLASYMIGGCILALSRTVLLRPLELYA